MLFETILSPTQNDSLTSVLGKIESLQKEIKTYNRFQKRISLRDKDSICIVKSIDIVYCEADGPYTKFHFSNKNSMMISKNLKEFEQILDPHMFMRSHHSFLVNIYHINRYEKADGGTLLMSNAKQVPVSQRKKEQLLLWIEQGLCNPYSENQIN
jgi:two-component system LytT family response regulator